MMLKIPPDFDKAEIHGRSSKVFNIEKARENID